MTETHTTTQNPALAGTIYIGHRTFQIDGVEFPWHITNHGPTVHRTEDGLYEVTITLFAENVICDADAERTA